MVLAATLLVAGCGDDSWKAQPISRAEAEGNRLIVGAHCYPDARASATESEDTVEVMFEVSGDRMGDCYGVAAAELERPLGDRQVVDASSGERVPVGPH